MNVATARLDATEATHNGKRVREHKLHWRKTMKARAAVAVGRPAPAPLDNEDSGCHARGGGDGGGVDQMQKLLRSSVLLDTRSSQHLEPIRLPGKLRDRIEKAQRRAAAAKDGISIFASSTEQSEASSSSSASPAPSTAMSTTNYAGPKGTAPSPDTPAGRSRSLVPSSADGGGLLLPVKEKKVHLPEVVLSHKMRDFEARTNSNSLLVDPLDNSLNKLTIEEKERVMARMQEKIQQITKDIDDNFLKIKDELDANGIFDSSANYQRAQAICLVELQKRCKLERLRDEAIHEVVGSEFADLDGAHLKDKRRNRMSGKLSLLLMRKSNQVEHEERRGSSGKPSDSCDRPAQQTGTTRRGPKHKNLHSQHAKLLPKLPVDTNQQHESENQARRLDNSHSNDDRSGPSSTLRDHKNRPSSSHEERAVRRGDSQLNSHRMVQKDDATGVGSGGGVGDGDDVLARHPHIAQVLQELTNSHNAATMDASNGGRMLKSTSRAVASTSNNNNNCNSLTDIEETRSNTAVEQWGERSRSYQTIASRVAEALRTRTERIRWDSTGHLTDGICSRQPISESLKRKLESRKAASATISGGSAGSDDEDSTTTTATRRRINATRETTIEQRKRVQQEYLRVQDQIRSRLQCEEKKKNTLASGSLAKSSRSSANNSNAASKPVVTTSQVVHQGNKDRLVPQDARAVLTPKLANVSGKSEVFGLASSISTSSLPAAGGFDGTATTSAIQSLGVSCSVPGLQSHFGDNPTRNAATGSVTQRRDGAHHSIVQRKRLSSPSHSRRFRKESLIGAPMATDFSTFGHYSNARIEERRNSAQTWAWHQSSASFSQTKHRHGHLESHDGHNEREEGSGGDTFETAIREEDEWSGDDGASIANEGDRDDCDDDADDSVSFSMGGGPGSARSARSAATLAHAATTRKHKLKRKPGGNNMHHHGGSSSNLNHTIGHGSASSMALQSRLEEIWKALEFPFSNKLLMLEKYAADLQDADMFQCALTSWEKAAEAVLLRERMQFVLAEFAEHREVRPASRLTGIEWMYARSLQIDTPNEPALQTMTSGALVEWIRAHMDAITSKCQQLAQELKMATGDDLHFQGSVYPPHM